jgi:7,8-dihydropterin-6-yl-methyl-4-(beta-D-ribofuranosyl)aminobenzene 5'-phosphate synthase
MNKSSSPRFAAKPARPRLPALYALAVLAILWPARLAAEKETVRITVLYDNTTVSADVAPDWGFACLVERGGTTALFDTGAKPDILRKNLAALRVDQSRIEALVISHDHSDHVLGIPVLETRPGMPVYFPQRAFFFPIESMAIDRLGMVRTPVVGPVGILPGFTVSEALSGPAWEDALSVDTPDGLVVIVGCAHPGIVRMLQNIRASTGRDIRAVVGGFHLLQTPADEVRRIIAEFRAMGVDAVCATHCTGEEAIRLFREAYGDFFIPGGAGKVLELPLPAAASR